MVRVKEKLTVKGMDCDGCAVTLDRVLKRLPGVRSVAVDWKNGFVDVDYDEKRSRPVDVRKAITNAGYEVSG